MEALVAMLRSEGSFATMTKDLRQWSNKVELDTAEGLYQLMSSLMLICE